MTKGMKYHVLLLINWKMWKSEASPNKAMKTMAAAREGL